MVTFAPSLMCMDLGKIKEQFSIMDNYMDIYHVDIMDGHFCKTWRLHLGFSKVSGKIQRRKWMYT